MKSHRHIRQKRSLFPASTLPIGRACSSTSSQHVLHRHSSRPFPASARISKKRSFEKIRQTRHRKYSSLTIESIVHDFEAETNWKPRTASTLHLGAPILPVLKRRSVQPNWWTDQQTVCRTHLSCPDDVENVGGKTV
jgi:hypothetical protein